MRRPLATVGVGLALGAAGAATAGRVLDSLPIRTHPADHLAFLAAIALVFLSALLACLASARHAVRVDPVSSLRSP